MTYSNFKNRNGERLDSSFHPGIKNKSLVILGHGVTGNKDRPLLVALASGLAELGWPCLRISFAGCGDSEGKFIDSNISKNSDDLIDIISALPEDLKIAYCGHSMGGAVGVVSAARSNRISCLVSLAGMVYTKEFCTREFGASKPEQSFMWEDRNFPLSNNYCNDLLSMGDTLNSVKALQVPFLLIHGSLDDVVYPQDSEAAFLAASQPKELVRIDGAGHSFDENSYPQIIKSVAAWLERAKI